MKRFIPAILISFLVLALFQVTVSQSQAAEPIKIGIIDTYTGPATTYTQDVLDGFKIAVNEVNAKGGVLGRKIEFVIRDDKFKPDIALAMAKELVLREKVNIIMGSTNSGGALAVSDFARREDPLDRKRCKKREDRGREGTPLRVQHQ